MTQTILNFVQSTLGVFPAEFQFITYCIAGLTYLLLIALVLRFFLGLIGGIFYH